MKERRIWPVSPDFAFVRRQEQGKAAKRPYDNGFQCTAAMQSFLLKPFTWWKSQTVGTRFWTSMYESWWASTVG
jgi:hypothetical protein